MFLCQLDGNSKKFLSLIVNDPFSGFNRPEIMSTKVDLPAPVSPLIPTNSFFLIQDLNLLKFFFYHRHN